MMEMCNRCLEEYPDEEMTVIKEFDFCKFCIPCAHHFKHCYADFLIHFLNTQDYSLRREKGT